MKFLKNTLLPILVLLTAIITLLKYFKKGTEKTVSSDNAVNDVIRIIDASLNKFGTFDKDHSPIFPALQTLSKNQLIKLHSDYPVQYYNPITGQKGLLQILNSLGLATEKDLNSLFIAEFSDFQISALELIYKNVGLNFPLIR